MPKKPVGAGLPGEEWHEITTVDGGAPDPKICYYDDKRYSENSPITFPDGGTYICKSGKWVWDGKPKVLKPGRAK